MTRCCPGGWPHFSPPRWRRSRSGNEGTAKTNGELLAAAQGEFDALVTMDRNIPFQQNLANVDLTIVLLEAPSNRLADLVPLVDEAKAVLSEARTGEVLRVQGL